MWVSRPYLAFGCRNPDPKLFYWIMLVIKCFHLEEKVCGKLKFEAILGKFMFGYGSMTKKNGVRLGKFKKKFKKKS
jgi:hypothetical protein